MGELKGKSDTLLEATLIRFDSNKYGEIYAEHIGNLTEKIICFSALGKDACQVSHLFIDHKGQYVFVCFEGRFWWTPLSDN